MPQTLLLADDSVTIQRVIELTFADEAITVVAVSDGDQAIARIEADPPDIVLVDIGMPGRTGYEVAQHIKQSPRLKHIPVLLLTGAFEPVDQAKAAAAGCDGVLAKPFEPQLVIARVKELLGRGADGAAPAATPAPATESSEPALLPGPSGETWGPSRPEPKGTLRPAEQVAHLDDYFDQLDAAFQKIGGTPPAEQPKAPRAASPIAGIIDWFGGTPAPSGPVPDLPLSTTAPPPQREREQTPDAPAPAVTKFVTEPAPETRSTFGSEAAPETRSRFVSEPALETPPAFVPEPGPETASRFVSEPEPVAALKFVSAPGPETASSRFVSEPEPVAAPKFVSAPERKTVTTTLEPASPATVPAIADAFAAILAAERHEPMPALGTPWPPLLPAPSNGGGTPSEETIEEITRRVLARLSDRVVRETVADAISNIAERLVRDEIERIKSSIK